MILRLVAGLGQLLMALLILGALCSEESSRGQEPQVTESQLKAAFLFNFAKFVEWPPTAFAASDTPITIGILGENPFGGDLEAITRHKTISTRPIVIKLLSNVDEATNCHVVFITASLQSKLPQVISRLGAASVLTVSDNDHFLENGGMIHFVKQGNKIRFEINEPAAQRVGLKISSKLMSLAVHNGGH